MENQLKIGDKAPYFMGVDQFGRTVEMNNFTDKKIILFFYPKASTPGCTAEVCDFQNNLEKLENSNYVLVGVSADSVDKQLKFSEKYNVAYPLIADVDKKIIQDYGVWGPKKFMGKEYDGIHRTTFIINEEGIIEDIITKVDTKNPTNQILKS